MLILILSLAGEPVSVTVGSRDSTLDLSQLSPGSSYEVTIVSTLGLDESDPIKDTVMTREFCELKKGDGNNSFQIYKNIEMIICGT